MTPPRAAPRLRDVIEEEITQGVFRPGDRLDELALARRYHVSRTPVREALLQLAASGLVVSRPRRGTIVAAHSAEEVVEMFEVMAELEGMAGGLAARRGKGGGAASDPDGYYYRNEVFHDPIYLGSHNHFLLEQCGALRRRLKPYRRLQLRFPGRLGTSFAEHESVVKAILDRNPTETQTLLRSHVIVQGDRFADLIASIRQMGRRADDPISKPNRLASRSVATTGE